MTTSDAKKPSKKRKLEDSPPWKSATTQTPTAFIIDGRRKSGRTNPIPPEFLAHPTPTRERRTSQRHTNLQSSNDVSSIRSASRSTTHVPRSQTNGKARLQSPTRTSGRLNKTPAKSSGPANTLRSPSTKKLASTSARTASKTTPTKAQPSKSRPSPAIGIRKSARTLKKAVAAAEVELAGSKRHPDGAGFANGFSDGESSFDSDGELELGSDFKAPKVKLKLKFGAPKPVITHPSQLPPIKPFGSFEEFLQQDDLECNPELLQEAESKAREEAKLRNRIVYEARFGVLTLENCSLFVPEKQPEPDRQYGHQDHLVAHALNLRKLMNKERKEHQELMRKRNLALMAEIKRRRPRTREEIEQEQYIENRKQYKEQVAQLRRKWDEVMKVSD